LKTLKVQSKLEINAGTMASTGREALLKCLTCKKQVIYCNFFFYKCIMKKYICPVRRPHQTLHKLYMCIKYLSSCIYKCNMHVFGDFLYYQKYQGIQYQLLRSKPVLKHIFPKWYLYCNVYTVEFNFSSLQGG